ncbi:MAG TPA: DUF2199 domain-containing protein [Candidatus Kapabacteria bacterium]|nr:DUF2199 domain-containing protein [Candidatus Kapabacteria bacterium]
MPAFAASAPLSYYSVPHPERSSRCVLGTDECVIDSEMFFVLGCLEVPVHGEEESFSWGVWVSLSEASFEKWRQAYTVEAGIYDGEALAHRTLFRLAGCLAEAMSGYDEPEDDGPSAR